MYDKFETLAMKSQLCVAVLLNPDATDFEFLPVNPHPLSDSEIGERKARWTGRDLHFAGAIGIIDGYCKVALDGPLDNATVSRLSAAFVAYCEVLLSGSLEEAAAQGDEVSWLRRLYALEDPRRGHSSAT